LIYWNEYRNKYFQYISTNVFTSAIEAFGRLKDTEKCLDILRDFHDNMNHIKDSDQFDEIQKLLGTFETQTTLSTVQRSEFENIKKSIWRQYNNSHNRE